MTEAIIAMAAAEAKVFDTLQARASLLGWALGRQRLEDGSQQFTLYPWASVRQARSLADVETILNTIARHRPRPGAAP